MRYKLTTEECLIFRDGRPFGDVGNFGGNSLKWPIAQTLTGMVRTATGFSRSPDYFKSKENVKNVKKIFEVGIEKIAPAVLKDGRWECLMPVPADLVLTVVQDKTGKKTGKLDVNPLVYRALPDGEGTDIANREWLIPGVDLREKPTKNPPFFAHWAFFDKYLKGEINTAETLPFADIGIHPPVADVRIHNALGASRVTEEGRLFANAAFYLKTELGKEFSDFPDKQKSREFLDLSIDFNVVNEKRDDISGDAWLGGERKRVQLSRTGTAFPSCPAGYENKKFLKLILTTHGDFGGWCPGWLKPDLNADTIDWTKIPETGDEIRLRSACVTGWDGVSGWDYRTKKPKAMKKLIRPGSVYLIEIKDPSRSSDIAGHFWGGSLCTEKESRYNGYGQCVVANASVEE